MGVPGLTREQVASHLQKYRNSTRAIPDPGEETEASFFQRSPPPPPPPLYGNFIGYVLRNDEISIESVPPRRPQFPQQQQPQEFSFPRPTAEWEKNDGEEWEEELFDDEFWNQLVF
ncbi:hypothetical protein M569_11583 [Genlisea aurea]|uniref:HTH myb-type domain-containing protein n=1 Tax=Genlisea aurea TaxID=192259 RepID=S8DTR1_9LAMI|nr:hypothetical protein M569_11583 [Genlisea aurea]